MSNSYLKDLDHAKGQTCNSFKDFFSEIKIEFLIHELKSPTAMVEAVVRGLLEAREIYGKLNAKQEKALYRALRNMTKMRDMIDYLLEIGRAEADSFFCNNFNPAKVAEQVLADELEGYLWQSEGNNDFCFTSGINWHQFRIRISISKSAHAMVMMQDEKKFRQIVANLVKNALHYRREWMEMDLASSKGVFRLKITDDGPGVPAEYHQAIFKRYTQIQCAPNQERGGHGLGLAGARIMARCLGGDIQIESKPEKGATFVMELPQDFVGTGQSLTA